MVFQIMLGVLAAALVGLLLIVIGWRGRRVSDTPVCGDCGFDLSSVLPDGVTCPECGGGLKRAKGVKHGLRKKRPVVLTLGIVLAGFPLALAASVALGSAVGVDWSAHKPVWLLSWEAEQGGATAIDALARELVRRDTAGTLTGADVERAAHAILDVQKNENAIWDDRLGDFIEQQVVRGTLGGDVKTAFDLNAVRISFEARERVALGGPVQLEAKIDSVRAGTGTQISGMLSMQHVAVGSTPVNLDRPGFGMGVNQFGGFNVWRNPGFGGGNDHVYGTYTTTVPTGVVLGTQRLGYVVRMSVYPQDAMNRGMTFQPGQEMDEFTREIVGSVPITILESGSELIEIVAPTPEQTAEIEEALGRHARGWVYDTGMMGSQVNLNLQDSSALPCPVVGWAKSEWRGKEWTIAPVVMRGKDPGRRGYSITWDGERVQPIPDGFDATTIDIVIEPDTSLAMGTTDITRIYGGTIEVKGVELEWANAEPGRVSKPNPVWKFLEGLATFDGEDAAEMTKRLEAIEAPDAAEESEPAGDPDATDGNG